jgi:Cft2 family RNA processing exonuclease
MAPLEVTRDALGLYLPALDLHLDPERAAPRSFVSHAHADHASRESVRGCGELYASRETVALVAARSGADIPGARIVPWDSAVELPFARGAGTARLSLAPAGHVRGAAQLVVDHPGGRFVYTGDYQSGAGCTHAAGNPVTCDQLVIESTFALPIFRFPDRATVREQIVAWCRARLDEGATPVLLAYSLGKSQELVHTLVAAGIPVVAHGAVFHICQAYEKLGVSLGLAEGKVLAYAAEKKREKRGAKLGSAACSSLPRAPEAPR